MTPNIHDIPGIGGFYTKKEVDDMIAAALAEAKAIQRKEYAILPAAIEHVKQRQ